MTPGDPPPARPYTAAGVLLWDGDGRVLLVKPTYKPGWEIPGGYVHPGESPGAAATREVREEVGLDVRPGRLLVVDWAPDASEGDKLLFVFDGGAVPQGATPVPDGSEVSEVGFFAEHRLDDVLVPRLARRVRVAMACRNRSSGRYLEHGVPPAAEPV